MENVYAIKGIKTLNGTKNRGYEAHVYLNGKKMGHASKLPDGGAFMFDADNTMLATMPEEIGSSTFTLERFITI